MTQTRFVGWRREQFMMLLPDLPHVRIPGTKTRIKSRLRTLLPLWIKQARTAESKKALADFQETL